MTGRDAPNPDAKPSPRPDHKPSEAPPEHADAIWAPWRLTYLESLDDGEAAANAETPPPEPPPPAEAAASFLHRDWLSPEDDHANHVLVRDEHGMILLNRYPYANGHLLVALGDPRPRLLDYDPAQRAALWTLVDRATDLLERTLRPQGVNIGLNQGRAAGAGVPQHLHVHLVPRWNGDVNFITTVGEVRVIPSALDAMAQRFRDTLTRSTP